MTSSIDAKNLKGNYASVKFEKRFKNVNGKKKISVR